MKGFLVKEWSLWNKIQHDSTDSDAEEDHQDISEPSFDEIKSADIEKDGSVNIMSIYEDSDDDEDASAIPNDPEKAALLHRSAPSYKSTSILRKAVNIITYILAAFVLMLFCSLAEYSFDKETNTLSQDVKPCMEHQISTASLDTNSTGLHEFVEIPILPELNYGPVVYQQNLLNSTFGNSWGIPAIAKYTPPPKNVNFTQVVLTIDLWVSGIQFDRLLHVYIDGAEIWRSSTPEPAGKNSHTFTQKDVSIYDQLFRKESELMVQLDNLIAPGLGGTFNISLNANYYNTPEDASLMPHNSDFVHSNDFDDVIMPGKRDLIFNHKEGATHAIPLVSAPKGRPPLVYYPDSDFHVVLPKVSHNTTRAKVLMYISANAEEEFWYTNLLDEYKDRFKSHGHVFGGHGPCRVVNVYHKGIRLDTLNPVPIIYAGGISPAFWNPIVSTGAYDIRALDFDVTTLLPYLWEGDLDLDIEVSNCIDENLPSGEVASGIGSNWISSANLLTWEDKNVASGTGSVISIGNSTKVSKMAFEPPFTGLLNQVVSAKFSNQIRTYFNYTFVNGSSIEFISEHYSSAKQNNVQVLKKFGSNQLLVLTSGGTRSHAIIDPVDNSTIVKFNLTGSFPVVGKVITVAADPPESKYSVDLVKSAKYKFGFNGTNVMKLYNSENGTSNYTLSPDGNHGIGIMEHNFTLSTNKGYTYNRHALGNNGTLVYDNITIVEDTKDDDKEIESSRHFIIEELQRITGAILDIDNDDIDMLKTFISYANQEDDDNSVDAREEHNKCHPHSLFRSFLVDH